MGYLGKCDGCLSLQNYVCQRNRPEQAQKKMLHTDEKWNMKNKNCPTDTKSCLFNIENDSFQLSISVRIEYC